MDFTKDELKTVCRALHGYIENLDIEADDLRNVGETSEASGKYVEMDSAENIMNRIQAEISGR